MTEREQRARHLLLTEVLPGYGLDPSHAEVEANHAGHINDSFRVRHGAKDLIVQRINSHVFANPTGLMENFLRVTEHVRRRLLVEGAVDVDRRCLQLEATASGDPWTHDSEGELWRATRFVVDTITRPVASDTRLAREAGRAYGRFQSLISDLEGELVETIPHFHDTPRRYQALDRAIDEDAAGRLASSTANADVAAVVEDARRQQPLATRLVDLATQHAWPTRIAHNDAKLTNVLLDATTERAMAVVDLDTVMPGLSLFDFGDMARSMSHRTAEDEDPASVHVDVELFCAIAEGYLETASHLETSEREHLVDAAQVLVLEQAVRYLTDDLDGDRYFRVVRERQNLDRARAHFALLASLQAHEGELRATVARL